MTNEALATLIREHAAAMADQCQAIAEGRCFGDALPTPALLHAACQRVESNAGMLLAWSATLADRATLAASAGWETIDAGAVITAEGPATGERGICARCGLEVEWVDGWHDRGANRTCSRPGAPGHWVDAWSDAPAWPGRDVPPCDRG